MPALLRPLSEPTVTSSDAFEPADDRESAPAVLTIGPPLGVDRSSSQAAEQVAGLVRRQASTLSRVATGPVLDTWRALAALGREDLTVARLVEGHVDALWILHEAGRAPVPGALYGVWASASGGTGLTGTELTGPDPTEPEPTEPEPTGPKPTGPEPTGPEPTGMAATGMAATDLAATGLNPEAGSPEPVRLTGPELAGVGPIISTGWSVNGTMRYCSGAWFVDRALVVIGTADGKRLVDLDVRAAQVPGGPLIRDEETWPAVGMDVTRSVDIAVTDLVVRPADLVGDPGFYLDRPGFAGGGVGVAAVWLGGAAGVLDALVRTLAGTSEAAGSRATAHQRAHLGAMAATIAAADALLAELAERIDLADDPGPSQRDLPAADAGAARTAVELAVEEVLARAPRVSGPTPLCRDAAFGHRLADLAVYVRQHHAEADYERLGSTLLESGELLGRRFG